MSPDRLAATQPDCPYHCVETCKLHDALWAVSYPHFMLTAFANHPLCPNGINLRIRYQAVLTLARDPEQPFDDELLFGESDEGNT